MDERGKKQITRRLVYAVKRSGMEQWRIAEKAGTTQGTISTYVNKHGVMPCADRLAELCKALHVSADWVLGLEEDPGEKAQLLWEQDAFRVALQKYGFASQRLMALEEMAELQNALCKEERGRDTREHIAEEIADVEIMLEQMKMYFAVQKLVRQKRREKVERLRERMDKNGR